jgi:hypothetical protein
VQYAHIRLSKLHEMGFGHEMKLRIAFFMTVSAASLALLPATAFCQPKTVADEASKLFQEANAFAAKNEFAKAAVAFNASYQKVPNPRALFNLAFVERKAGDKVSSAEHFAAYLTLPDSSKIDAASRGEANQYLTELGHELCTVTIVGPPGVTGKVGGRSVRGAVGFAPPGTVATEINVGPVTKKRDIQCAAGQALTADFDDKAHLAAVGPAVLPPPGGTAVTPPVGPAIGNPPNGPAPEVVYVPEHDEKRPIFLYLAIGTGALGVAGMVGGVLAGGKSSEYADTLRLQSKTEPCTSINKTSQACQLATTTAANATSSHNTSVALWVAGGTLTAVAAAFTILYVAAPEHIEAQGTPPKANGRSPRRVAAPTVRLAPTLDGAMLFGQF